MSDASNMAERHGRILERLSELGLSLAEAAHERAMAAETPAELRDMTLTFHRISRSLRQTLALEARLERQRQACAREAAEAEAAEALDAPVSEPDAVERRKIRVRRALARLIWEEAERDEDEIDVLTDDLDARLDEAALRDDFEDIPVEMLIRQLKDDMGLEGELTLTACTAPEPAPPHPNGGGPAFLSDEWATGRAAPNSS